MNWETVATNWVAWFLRILALSAMGYFAPRLLHLSQPRSRLIAAQLTLAACCIVPLLAHSARSRGEVSVSLPDRSAGPVPGQRVPRQHPGPWSFVFPILFAAGALFRLTMLGGSLLKLRGYLQRATILTSPPRSIGRAFENAGVRCTVAVSNDLDVPAAFGCLNPVVLLPVSFENLTPEAQTAVVCHELIHVRRQDWLAAFIEEVVVAFLWFQPAVHWLAADIRLTREMLVDRQTVLLTSSKAHYLKALVAVASASFRPAISGAPLLLERCELKARIAFLLEEISMSKLKLTFANVSLAALLFGTGWVSSVTFPITAVAQEKSASSPDEKPKSATEADYASTFPPADGPRIRIGGNVLAANLISQVKPPYPAEAKANGIQGTVKLGVLVDKTGHVADLALISGPPQLTQAAYDAVRQWFYRPTLLNGQPVEVVSIIDVNFTLAQ